MSSIFRVLFSLKKKKKKEEEKEEEKKKKEEEETKKEPYKIIRRKKKKASREIRGLVCLPFSSHGNWNNVNLCNKVITFTIT